MPTLNANQINGIVRTSEPVWSNLERLSEASTAWFTYNTHNGLYGHVVNAAGNSVASITEADIIGPIQISGSGLTNLYNAVEIEYPRNDMRDQPHYATLLLPDGLRNEYEPDNTLQISSEFINNQPQAEHYAMITLKQSRLDLTVTIVMDYTKINLQAGNIIDITSDTYGWTNKEFRIMRVREIEGDDGSLRLEFSSTEYDDTIYDGTWDQFLVAGTPGIRSIGAIGTPATPTITLTTVDSLPAQVVSTTVPAGVVDRVQFWAGNVLITGNVANTNYNLVGTQASTDANAFVTGNTVVFTTTSLRDGTWSWKSRGVNGDGTGPFSTASANVVYVRDQAPDVIKVGTPFVGPNGEVLSSQTTGGSVGSYSFSSVLVDTIQISGTPNKAIFTTPVYMIKIGNVSANLTVGNVTLKGLTQTVPAANVVLQLDHSATLLDTDRATIGQGVGQSIWYSTAPWDQGSFNANGFRDLAYTNWKMMGIALDSANVLSGNLRHTTLGTTPIDLTNFSGNILAIGVSSTYLPNGWGNVTQTNGVITNNVVVSGNTVLLQETTTGIDTFLFPGNTAGASAINGGNDSVINYRLFF